jgi:hypothetical protein
MRHVLAIIAALALVACGSEPSPPATTVDLGSVLVDDYPCGHGFWLGSGDQAYGLFVEFTDYAGASAGMFVEPMSLVDGRWSAQVRVGSDLFANWCDDVVEPGEPQPTVLETWPATAGTIQLETLPAPGECGPAGATVSGLVIDTGDGLIELPDVVVSNPSWGCFAG